MIFILQIIEIFKATTQVQRFNIVKGGYIVIK